MNLSEYNNKIPEVAGLSHGVLYGQFDRTDELNARQFERTRPDQPLPPNFDPRPVLTKYSIFPMLDARMPATVPIQPNYDYSLYNNFTPPVMSVGPVSGYINKVDTENTLRNQYFALQKGADQSSYVPSANSDLYNVYVPSSPSVQPFPGLFTKPQLDQTVHPNMQGNPNIGRDIFNNYTRVQLREPTVPL